MWLSGSNDMHTAEGVLKETTAVSRPQSRQQKPSKMQTAEATNTHEVGPVQQNKKMNSRSALDDPQYQIGLKEAVAASSTIKRPHISV